MPTYTSEARQLAYAHIRLLSKQRAITSAQYRKEKAKIDAREAKAVAYAESKRAAKAAAAALKRELKKIPSSLLLSKQSAVDQESAVWNIFQTYQGSTVRIIQGGFDKIISIGTGKSAYKTFRAKFKPVSDGDWEIDLNDVLVLRPNTIAASKLNQKFRDGINHCVFEPLISKLEGKLGGSESVVKRTKQRIAALEKMKQLWDDGVPEDVMEEVARTAGIKIRLFDVLGNEVAQYNKNGQVGTLSMTNTRENHIDIGMVIDSDAVEIGVDEIRDMWDNLKHTKTFYMIDGDLANGQPKKIRTLEGCWKVADPIRDACNQFDKEIGTINYKIDAIKFPELNAFIRAGRIVNGWSCRFNDDEATGCADMPAAYTQFKTCHMYAGFLGHIHQFRSGSFNADFVRKHLGYYAIKITGGVSWMMERLGLYVGLRTVLFGPELLYFMSQGLEGEIVEGAWGSRFDFDFPEYMLADRRYCIWAGLTGVERMETSHTMSASPEWAAHIMSEHKAMYWEQDGLLTIKKPVKRCLTSHHILGALTSYVRIQMMEAMKQFEPHNLIRVVLDGIYYKGEKPAALNWFSDKKVKTEMSSMPWYDEVYEAGFPAMGAIDGNALLIGQGGSGKTYSVFTDKGFNDILFVTPAHILGQDVYKKYGARYTTIHKLIGVDCIPYYTEHRVPAVIFVDEITQLHSDWVDKVFELYPNSLIILAGDIDEDGRWYQCRTGDGTVWNEIWKPVGVKIIEFTEDRRSRDDLLRRLKLGIRDAMKQCTEEIGEYQMTDWAKRTLPRSAFDFQPGDTCIAGTHKINEQLLSMGIVSGYYKKGGYVSDVEQPGYEARGSFTIHSYQGKTIETGNVWIFIDSLFEYAMLYTAVSRAVNYSQIKFVTIPAATQPPALL